MALFSRRKKSEPTPEATEPPAEEPTASAASEVAPAAAEVAPALGVDADTSDAGAQDGAEAVTASPAPEVSISVQAFRGVGANAGPEVSLEADAAPAQAQPAIQVPGQQIPAERPLPLAPVAPPEQKHTVPGMQDNVLLRDTLARLNGDPTNEQLLGVLRQMLQGHLILRVHGDAQEQLAKGQSLSIGILRDGERSFMLAFSSAEALRKVLVQDAAPENSSAVAQPVMAVLHQVVAGDFTGLVLDNASAPHRVVFPTEVLKRAIDEADPNLTLKGVLAVPHEGGAEAPVAAALATSRLWVAGGQQSDGQIGVAEMRSPDGKRFLQVFSHPLEVVAMGRGERPLPFTAEQLGKVLVAQPELSGVLVDPAGPSVVVRREALGEVVALAAE